MLECLEYRGYDSAGIALLDGSLKVIKDKGRVAGVKSLAPQDSDAKCAIGHSRWATHGEPSKRNAHPHTSSDGKIAIVHNGIIENYLELAGELKEKGYSFESETDSETIVKLIEDYYKEGSFEDAFHTAVSRLEGSFAVLCICEDAPDKILFARNESPLIIGLGDSENFLASDMPAFLADTKRAIILDDMEWGILTSDSATIKDIKSGAEIKKEIIVSDLSLEAAEKGGYEHFMLKEIIEEPLAIRNALGARQAAKDAAEYARGAQNIHIVACGTAWHASVVAKYFLRENGVLATTEVASEFRYSSGSCLTKDDLVVLISQSGETADTIAAAKEAKKRGAKTVAIVNVVGSSLTRICDKIIYTYSGPEIAVASTKAYIGQLVALTLFCAEILREKGALSDGEVHNIFMDIENLPPKVDEILDGRESLMELAQELVDTKDYFYIGRGASFATAMEGALKLKEISYLHAEAYAGGELKHGPLALMEKSACVVAINPDGPLKKKTDSNIIEIKSRGARVIEVVDGEHFSVLDAPERKIIVPFAGNSLFPITTIVPLHLLAYYVALLKGHDIDKPRNLAKSVTVE